MRAQAPVPASPMATTDVEVVPPAAEDGLQDQNPLATPPAPVLVPAKIAEKAPSTRVGRAWNSVIPTVVLLALMLVFTFQNLHTARVRFLTVSATLPLAVALLGAAAIGGLFVLALGSVRMVQLRRAIRRVHKANANGNPGASK
jgi:uncharacterized integral membrane protein